MLILISGHSYIIFEWIQLTSSNSPGIPCFSGYWKTFELSFELLWVLVVPFSYRKTGIKSIEMVNFVIVFRQRRKKLCAKDHRKNCNVIGRHYKCHWYHLTLWEKWQLKIAAFHFIHSHQINAWCVFAFLFLFFQFLLHI